MDVMENQLHKTVVRIDDFEKSGWTIPLFDFRAQYEDEREAIVQIVDRVFSRGTFVGAEHLTTFESMLAHHCGTSNAIAVGSGTDALILAMKAIGIGAGNEVITPPNSHFSSTSSIIIAGATPVFADVGEDQNIDPEAVEAAITNRTKAIMPVHLTGRIADMDRLMSIAKDKNLFVVEDAAQAFGSRFDGRPSGSLGHVAAFSAHPFKVLNSAGDAGYISTNDVKLAERLSRLRNNGLKGRDEMLEWGRVSRMDVLQAEILTMRLNKIEPVIAARRRNADIYREKLKDLPIYITAEKPKEFNTYQNFVIRLDQRDALRTYLSARSIQTAIHYPLPIHLQPAAKSLGYGPGRFPNAETQAKQILTLPVNQYLSESDIDFVAETICEFMRRYE